MRHSVMKSLLYLAFLIAVVLNLSLAGVAVAGSAAPASVRPAVPRQDGVARGRYLVESIGCSDCHTPKKRGPQGLELDAARLLSGHPEAESVLPAASTQGPWAVSASWDLTAWTGPWGVSYAANLTPDTNTGLGIWTEDMFVKALRTGRHMGVSRQILPPMPWRAFRNLKDEDLQAIYAYLRTLKPIQNRVPEPTPPNAAAAAGGR